MDVMEPPCTVRQRPWGREGRQRLRRRLGRQRSGPQGGGRKLIQRLFRVGPFAFRTQTAATILFALLLLLPLGALQAQSPAPAQTPPATGHKLLPFGKSFRYQFELNGSPVGTLILTFGLPETIGDHNVVEASQEQVLDAVPGLPRGTRMLERSRFRIDTFQPLEYSAEQQVGQDRSVMTVRFNWDAGTLTVAQEVGGRAVSQTVPMPPEVTDPIALVAQLYAWSPAPGDVLEKVVLNLGPFQYEAGDIESVETPVGVFPARQYHLRSPLASGTLWVADGVEGFLVQSTSRSVTGDSGLELVSVEGAAAVAAPARVDPEKAQAVRAPVIQPEGYRNEEVEFASGDLALAGTLSIPDGTGPHPAVLLVAGSGPVDRNSDVPGGIPTAWLARWADALARQGYAVLRYDKRGIAESEGDFSAAGFSDLVADAVAAVQYLAARPEVDPDRVIVVGHSEGALIAPLVAAKAPWLAGIALLAGPARPLDQIAEAQLRYFYALSGIDDSQVVEQGVALQRQLLDAVRRGETTLNGQPIPLPIKWWQEHMAHDALAAIRQVRVPVLLLQGSQDFQVPPEHAHALSEALAQARLPHRLVVIDGLDHLFMRVDGVSTPESYLDVHRPLSAVAVAELLRWLNERTGLAGGS